MKRSFLIPITITGLLFLTILLIVFLNWERLVPPIVEQVTLGTSHSISASLLFIALEQGFLRQEGIELNFQEYKSAKLAFDDVCDGQLDLALVAETPVVFTAFERRDFHILASLYADYNDPKILARKASGITTPATLQGKRIGTTAQGQSAHYF